MRVAPGLTSSLALALLAAGASRAEIHSRMGRARPNARALLQAVPNPTHRIPASVVVLVGSGWSKDVVKSRVNMTREILAQCGIELDASIAELEGPAGTARVLYEPARSEEPSGMGAVARLLRPSAAPALFYIDRFEDNAGQSGTSRPPLTSAGRPEVDTVWIPFMDRVAGWNDSYHVDAHELVHVLADTGHSVLPTTGVGRSPRKEDPVDPAIMDGGLMAGNPAIRSNRIAPALCEKMKRHPFARGL